VTTRTQAAIVKHYVKRGWASDVLSDPFKTGLEEAETDEGAGEIEERKVEVRQALVADHQATEAVEPGKRPLDDPPEPPELVAGLDAPSSTSCLIACARCCRWST
jgi:hypothetical protein